MKVLEDFLEPASCLKRIGKCVFYQDAFGVFVHSIICNFVPLSSLCSHIFSYICARLFNPIINIYV